VLFLVHRFLSPWWRRRQVPPKRRFLQEPRGVTTQKTPFFVTILDSTGTRTPTPGRPAVYSRRADCARAALWVEQNDATRLLYRTMLGTLLLCGGNSPLESVWWIRRNKPWRPLNFESKCLKCNYECITESWEVLEVSLSTSKERLYQLKYDFALTERLD
jgi:hypothetical protein